MSQVQTACERCGSPLVPDASYCERCGMRTHKARRMVRLAFRVEMLFLVLVVVLVIAFTYIYAIQK